MIPNPNQLFESFERGEIERDELQAMMALHARELISEMEEDHQNPAAALIELLLSRRSSSKLARRHGGRVVREVLFALSQVPDFAPAKYLWNAMHPDVPLHCFLRIRRVPIFRIVSMEKTGESIFVETQHGSAEKGESVHRKFTLKRGEDWKLKVV